MSGGSLPGRTAVAENPGAVADAAAHWLVGISADAVRERGRFSIALAGGSTPRLLYTRLTGGDLAPLVDWPRWWCYFGDERACPPDDPASNYTMARTTLLEHVPVDGANVFRMPAERDDLDAAAADYARTLAATVGEPPVFDCVLLGLGENGHTASLFPGTAALDVTDAWCVRGLADYAPYDRLTLTFGAINAARHVAFFVTGATKVEALREVISGSAPASRVRPTDGTLTWFLDEAAASGLAAGTGVHQGG